MAVNCSAIGLAVAHILFDADRQTAGTRQQSYRHWNSRKRRLTETTSTSEDRKWKVVCTVYNFC